MFATIDSETYRLVCGFIDDGDQRRPLPLPEELKREAFELRVVPTEKRASRLARRWAEIRDDGQPITLEIWRLRYQNEGPVLHIEVAHRVHSS